MQLYLTGINYKHASIDLRQQLVLDNFEIRDLLRLSQEQIAVKETVILSTCNRTEMYAVMPAMGEYATKQLSTLLLDYFHLNENSLKSCFYHLRGLEAANHLFRVAAGLDSLVLGEDQILAQIHQAYFLAVAEKSCAKIMNKLFQQSFRVGKRSRHETGISSGSASVSSVAVKLTQRVLGDISAKKVLIIGAGEMAHKALSIFRRYGVSRLLISNRSLDKAASLAGKFNAQVIPFEQIPAALQKVDIVLSATAAKEIILSYPLIKAVTRQRQHQLLCLLDIAVPRNIDPKIREISNVILYDLDDLQAIFDENLKNKQQWIPVVEQIIAEELHAFYQWYQNLAIIPVIKQLQEHFEGIRQQQFLRYRKKFCQKDWESLDRFAKTLMKKWLHHPIVWLYESKTNLTQKQPKLFYEIFGLDES